jgi:cyanophycinase
MTSLRITHLLLLALVCCAAFTQAPAQNIKGHLVIIGGGERTTDIMQRFVALAGGPDKARIIIIPLASGEPQETGKELVDEFKSYGVTHVDWLLFSKEEAMADSTCAKFNGATGVYFSGGDQVRITRVIVGTPVQQKLFVLYRDGAVIGGTSAGAAIMSKVMITGDELINKDTNNIFVSIQKGNVQTIEGVGFLNTIIVDQHFVKRKRLNRLISVVLEHPELPGLGIDESTAMIVSGGDKGEVMGRGTIVMFDARNARDVHTDSTGDLAARNIVTHIYSAGERFSLKTLKPLH